MAYDPPCTTDPDGRHVVFDAGSHLHLAHRRPWLLDRVDMILDAVNQPDLREDDPLPGRERFYRHHTTPGSWLRVVVDFNSQPAWVVTALVQDFDPPRTAT
jgi:hypothetical protein